MKIATILLTTGLFILPGCDSKSGYTSYGAEVITVDAEASREVGVALVEVQRSMGNWIENDDGTRSDPTYKAGNKNFKTDGKLTASRGYIEWKDKEGQTFRLETIQIADKFIVITCDGPNDKSAMALHNELLRQLKARGLVYKQ